MMSDEQRERLLGLADPERDLGLCQPLVLDGRLATASSPRASHSTVTSSRRASCSISCKRRLPLSFLEPRDVADRAAVEGEIALAQLGGDARVAQTPAERARVSRCGCLSVWPSSYTSVKSRRRDCPSRGKDGSVISKRILLLLLCAAFLAAVSGMGPHWP